MWTCSSSQPPDMLSTVCVCVCCAAECKCVRILCVFSLKLYSEHVKTCTHTHTLPWFYSILTSCHISWQDWRPPSNIRAQDCSTCENNTLAQGKHLTSLKKWWQTKSNRILSIVLRVIAVCVFGTYCTRNPFIRITSTQQRDLYVRFWQARVIELCA